MELPPTRTFFFLEGVVGSLILPEDEHCLSGIGMAQATNLEVICSFHVKFLTLVVVFLTIVICFADTDGEHQLEKSSGCIGEEADQPLLFQCSAKEDC